MSVEEKLARHLKQTPDTGRAKWVSDRSVVVGDVVLEKDSSVFYGAVLRGDIARIRVGEGTNIQDNAVVHLADDGDAIIGKYCTIGHAAVVHACTIEDECLIGIGAVVLNGARVGKNSIVAVGALVTPGTQIPAGSIVMGAPAKVVRALSIEEQADLRKMAEKYISVAAAHASLSAGPK